MAVLQLPNQPCGGWQQATIYVPVERIVKSRLRIVALTAARR